MREPRLESETFARPILLDFYLCGTRDGESNRVSDHFAAETAVEAIAKAATRLGPAYRLPPPLIESRHRRRPQQRNRPDRSQREIAKRLGVIGRLADPSGQRRILCDRLIRDCGTNRRRVAALGRIRGDTRRCLRTGSRGSDSETGERDGVGGLHCFTGRGTCVRTTKRHSYPAVPRTIPESEYSLILALSRSMSEPFEFEPGERMLGVTPIPFSSWTCEWIGPAVVLRLMDELIRRSELRDRATWYLLPVMDADGYRRTWAGERFRRTTENGENPNLNFPYRWGEAPWLLSRLLGKKLRGWMGPHPASAGCVKSLVSELKRLTNLQLFLDFHGFGRLWLYPWCHTKEPSPHHTEHEAAAAAAVAAANRVAGHSSYKAQAAALTEAPMGGSCIDFVYHEIGCVHSYAVELPPSLPRGGVLGATLLGALGGDPKRWWRKGQAPSAEIGVEAGDEMAVALSALIDHLFGTHAPPRLE